MRTCVLVFVLTGSMIRPGVTSGQATRPDSAAGASSIKPTAPTAPEKSLARLHVSNGFTAERMASEPLVNDPVAIAWGPDGKLWIVEMIDYPLGKNGNMEPYGRGHLPPGQQRGRPVRQSHGLRRESELPQWDPPLAQGRYRNGGAGYSVPRRSSREHRLSHWSVRIAR
jgi:hypothetical protein